MSDDNKVVKSIFKGGTIIFIGLLISKLGGLTYRVLVGRYIGPEEYGIISVMLAVSSIIGAFAYLGIPKGVQKYVAEYRGKNKVIDQIEVTQTGLKLITVSSIIAGAILYLIAPWLAIEFFDEERALWPIRMIALIMPFRAWRKVLTSVTDAYERMEFKVYSNYIYTNVAKIFLAIVLIYAGYGYLGAAFAYAFGWGTAFILSAYFAKKLLPDMFKPSYETNQYSKLFHHSWPLFAAGLLSVIAGQIDTLMLQYFLSAQEVGLYNAAYPFAALLAAGTTIFSSIYLSNASKLVSKGKIQETARSYQTVIKWILMATIPLFILMMVIPETFLLIFGAEYTEMGNVLRILGIGFLMSAMIGPSSTIFQAVDKTKIKLYITLIISTSNILLNIILIPIYGVIGAAIATTATFGLGLLVKTAFIYKTINHLPFRPITAKIIIAGLITGITSYLISKITEFGEITTFTTITLIIGITYTTLILALKILEKEDLVVIKYIEDKTGIKIEKINKILEKHTSKQ